MLISPPRSTDKSLKSDGGCNHADFVVQAFSAPLWSRSCETAKLMKPLEKGNPGGAHRLSRKPKSTGRRLFSGWRFPVTVCAATAIVVFVINAVVTIWVATNPRFPMRGGVGLLHRGSCATSKRATIWLHLVINILATLLLSAGNYSMQFLSSPTRKEVDRAHAEKKWLHIGVLSFRNLKVISSERLVLWLILAVSSFPLHLVYVHTLPPFQTAEVIISLGLTTK